MIVKESCGCVYLECNGLTVIISACDRDASDPYVTFRRLPERRHADGAVEPVSAEAAMEYVASLQKLVAAGHAAKDLDRALRMLRLAVDG